MTNPTAELPADPFEDGDPIHHPDCHVWCEVDHSDDPDYADAEAMADLLRWENEQTDNPEPTYHPAADVYEGPPGDPTLVLKAKGIQVCWVPDLTQDGLWIEPHRAVLLNARLCRADVIVVVKQVVEMIDGKGA